MLLDSLLLFAAAFLSATFVPFYSEVILIKLLLDYPSATVMLVFVASIGNTGGACVNWLMGRYLLHYQDRAWFPVKPQQLTRAQAWFQRFGQWSLLLSWLPLGGDAITLLAGILRVPFPVFFVLTFAGKMARYVFLAVVVQQTLG